MWLMGGGGMMRHAHAMKGHTCTMVHIHADGMYGKDAGELQCHSAKQ